MANTKQAQETSDPLTCEDGLGGRGIGLVKWEHCPQWAKDEFIRRAYGQEPDDYAVDWSRAEMFAIRMIATHNPIINHLERRASELLSGGKAILTVRDEILAGQHNHPSTP